MLHDADSLAAQVRDLGQWFHNLHLGEAGTIETAPNHVLGDFPRNFWQHFCHSIPDDLTGKTVLDIGCNAGFYSFEMKKRGASRVLGIDNHTQYLAQAEFARSQLGLDVEFRRLDVYRLHELGDEQFDYVLFMGVFYHLRHPLFALEEVVRHVRGRMLFQTMERGSGVATEFTGDYPITEMDVFLDPRFPAMYFVEHSYAGDPTNWWIPNASATEAILRSVGMRVVDHPCREVYVCEPERRDERGQEQE